MMLRHQMKAPRVHQAVRAVRLSTQPPKPSNLPSGASAAGRNTPASGSPPPPSSGAPNGQSSMGTGKPGAASTNARVPPSKSGSVWPKLFLLSVLSAPAATALYVNQNPQWNPSILQHNEQWIQFRELVLGPEAKKAPKQGNSARQSLPATSSAVTAKGSPQSTKPKPSATKSADELSEIITRSSPKKDRSVETKPSPAAALKKRTTKKIVSDDDAASEASAPKAAKQPIVSKKSPAQPTKAAEAESTPKAKKAAAEPTKMVDKKVDDATRKEKEAITTLSTQASAAVLSKKVEEQIQSTTSDIVDTLQKESDSAADEVDKNYMQGLKDLDANSLIIRVAQLATEMKHRSKWEGVRLVEALRRMESDAQKKTSEILQRQDELHKEVLARELRLQKEIVDRNTREEMNKLKKDYAQELSQAISEHKTKISNELKAAFEKDKKAIEDNYQRQITAKSNELQAALAKERQSRLEELESFRAQLRALNEVLTSSSTYEAFSHQVHKTSVAALALSDRIEAAAPLRAELKALREAARSDPFIETAIRTLPQRVIEDGAPSVSQLQDRFQRVRHVGRRAAMIPPNSGLIGQLFGGALSYLIIAPGGPIEGMDAEAIFSRAEYALKTGDIEKAVEEMKSLDGLAADVSQDWIEAAKSRLEVEQTSRIVKAHVALLAASCS